MYKMDSETGNVQNLLADGPAEPFRAIVAEAADAVVGINTDQRIVIFNRASELMFKLSVEEAIGQPLTILIPEEFRKKHNKLVHGFRSTKQKSRYMGERGSHLMALRSDGSQFPAAVSILSLESETGPITVALLRDITERISFLEEQTRLASIDSLTNTLNRRAFFKQAEVFHEQCALKRICYAVLLMDLDQFKSVNDMYGHAVGDGVLRSFSDLCKTTLREKDLFARWGGEEFVALLPETDLTSAIAIAERIRVKTEKLAFDLPQGDNHKQTVSIGATTRLVATACLDDVIGRADRALYSAKAAGRNCVHNVNHHIDTEATKTG